MHVFTSITFRWVITSVHCHLKHCWPAIPLLRCSMHLSTSRLALRSACKHRDFPYPSNTDRVFWTILFLSYNSLSSAYQSMLHNLTTYRVIKQSNNRKHICQKVIFQLVRSHHKFVYVHSSVFNTSCFVPTALKPPFMKTYLFRYFRTNAYHQLQRITHSKTSSTLIRPC
jgi:hypothetical protein